MTSVADTIELQPRHEDTQSNRITPKRYAQLVLGFSKYSKHTLYPGQHYTALARFLISPYRHSLDGDNFIVEKTPPNAVYLYDLAIGPSEPERVQIFDSTDQIDRYDDETRRMKHGGRIVFLQGYLSPQWLNHIGSKFEVDPEFYFRHLDFSSSQPSPEYYPMLSLPSSAEIIRVRITSILSWNNFQPYAHHTTSSLRALCERRMTEYLRNLGNDQNVLPSDSIVRRFSVLDTHHFAIEQIVTMHVNCDNPGWTALVWLDHGREIHLSRHGPWKDLQRGKGSCLTPHPIIQYRKRVALRGGGDLRPPNGKSPSGHPIASTYGSSLRPEIMETDAFYALAEIFRLSIAAESQFLTFISHKIKQAIANDQIQDLQHILAIIEDHREHIRENISSVKSGGHVKWPKAPEQLRAKALINQELLQKDLEHLQLYAQHLVERCTGGISVMMNEAMFKQSQRAIEQTEATIKLSTLVYLFAPLSVTTSFFSMSVKEVTEAHLSVWVWAVASTVMLGLSFVLWKWNPFILAKQAWVRVRGILMCG